MKEVLVFGGTRFFGKKLVKVLVDEGYDVTIATRGITKDSLEDKVKRIIVDRENREDLEKAFSNKKFDVVYDNICYSPNGAINVCDIFKGNVGKYIFTSTLSVYDEGLNLKEEDFNPYNYEIKYGEREEFDYGEGKRLAEAVFFQKATFPVVAVRFPIVIGEEDYTGRLFSYAENIYNEKDIFIDNLESQMSFISSEEAGEFLHWISTKDFRGPINACNDGNIQIKEIIRICEENLNKKWIAAESDAGEVGAFNGFYRYTLDNKKAKSLGFQFKDVCEETEKILVHLMQQL